MKMNGRRPILLVQAAFFLLKCFPADCMATVAAADSSRFFRWSSVYSCRMGLYRSDTSFPWNASGSDSLFRDRVSGSVHAGEGGELDLFIKAGSGVFGGALDALSGSLFMEQAHLRFRPERVPAEAAFFVRERVFGPWTRLLPVISNDSPLLPESGAGVVACVGKRDFRLSYSFSSLNGRSAIDKHGGLPVFGRSDGRLDFLEGFARCGYGHLGVTLSTEKSPLYGDASVLGTELSLRRAGVALWAGFARSVEGGWEDLTGARIFDIDPSMMKIGRASAGFSPGTAIAAEVTGIEYSRRGSGRFGLIPSYRYHGIDFSTPQGEIRGGLVESRVTTYWKHPRLAMMAAVDFMDRYSRFEEGGGAALAGYVRARFKRGFEISEGMILREKSGSSMIVSMLDESDRTTVSMTARLDERGDDRELSFFAECGLKAGHSWVVRNTMLLQRSEESFYNLSLEFRPDRRYMFVMSAGSFRPWAESIGMMDEPGLFHATKERFISISTRIWMGGF